MQPVRPKKHLGQHFLADKRRARAIAQALAPQTGELVVEIGPGAGVLTQPLLDTHGRVLALEVDPESVTYLHQQNWAGLTVQQGDVLKLPWPQGPLVLTGNLPYNLTSPILFRLLDYRQQVRQAVFMVQKEVADRIVARPGNKVYGLLSVLLGVYYKPTYLFTVPPGAFVPPPRVYSAVFQLERKPQQPQVEFAALKQVAKTAFNQRRKMLRNTLGPILALPEAYATQRPENLSPAQFVELANLLPPQTDLFAPELDPL